MPSSGAAALSASGSEEGVAGGLEHRRAGSTIPRPATVALDRGVGSEDARLPRPRLEPDTQGVTPRRDVTVVLVVPGSTYG